MTVAQVKHSFMKSARVLCGLAYVIPWAATTVGSVPKYISFFRLAKQNKTNIKSPATGLQVRFTLKAVDTIGNYSK